MTGNFNRKVTAACTLTLELDAGVGDGQVSTPATGPAHPALELPAPLASMAEEQKRPQRQVPCLASRLDPTWGSQAGAAGP